MIFQYFTESIVPRLLDRRQSQESTFQTTRPKVTTASPFRCGAKHGSLRFLVKRIECCNARCLLYLRSIADARLDHHREAVAVVNTISST